MRTLFRRLFGREGEESSATASLRRLRCGRFWGDGMLLLNEITSI